MIYLKLIVMPFSGYGNTGGGQNGDRPGGGGGDVISGLIQVGAGLYDSHQNRKVSRENTDKTIAAQKSEAELAYQRSMDMWNVQNQYNSPEAQMQRFMDAGLNPHLIYGQGNSGNASAPPAYSPPDVQYRYAAGSHGQAVGAFLPTLMAVGTWMQNMRATEAGIRKTEADTTRTDTTVEQMLRMNPELFKKLQGDITLQTGQKGLQDIQRDKMVQSLRDLESEFRFKYGDELWKSYGSNFTQVGKTEAKMGGTKALQFLQEKQKLMQAESTTKLKEAQASWADFDITNPQQIMMLVLNGVLSMAGGAVKLKAGKAAPTKSQVRAGSREMHPSRRIQKRFKPDR